MERDKQAIEESGKGSTTEVVEPFARGANIEADIRKCDTALRKAARRGSGSSALMYAADAGHLQVVEELLVQGANIEAKDKHGCTALIVAADGGRVQVVDELLKRGANVETADRYGRTALMGAACGGHVQVVDELLKRDVNIEAKDKKGCTALMYAADEGHVQVVQKLLKRNANLGAKNKHGCTALIIAADEGHVQVVEELLKHGADIETKDRHGCTALMGSARRGHVQLVEELLKYGAKVEAEDNDGFTAPLWAAYCAHQNIVQLLLPRVGDIETKRDNCWNALLRQLLQADLRIEGHVLLRSTALMIAASEGHILVVDQLLKHGADLETRDNDGCSALIYASRNGHEEVVRELLLAGAQVDARNWRRSTALMEATRLGHVQVMDELLKHGASVHLYDQFGDTSMHIAARESCSSRANGLHMVALLYRAGADPFKKNDKGTTPLSFLPTSIAAEMPSSPLSELQLLWLDAKSAPIKLHKLLAVLQADVVHSFPTFVLAHNLLLLAVRQRVIPVHQLRMLGGSRDFVFRQVYLPVTSLPLSDEYKLWFSRVLLYAERVGFIREGHASMKNIVAHIRSELLHRTQQMQYPLITVAREINNLELRIDQHDNWSQRASTELQNLCLGQPQMQRDMLSMVTSLRELHSVLNKKQLNQIIAGVLSFCLSMIPVLDVTLAQTSLPGASTSSATGMTELLMDDIGDIRIVKLLIGSQFLAKLDPSSRERIEFVVQQTEFKTLSNLEQQLGVICLEPENVAIAKELQLIVTETEEEALYQRFNNLASRNSSCCLSIQEATIELQQLRPDHIQPEVYFAQVEDIVAQHKDSMRRVLIDAFMLAVYELKSKYITHQLPSIFEAFRITPPSENKLPHDPNKELRQVLNERLEASLDFDVATRLSTLLSQENIRSSAFGEWLSKNIRRYESGEVLTSTLSPMAQASDTAAFTSRFCESTKENVAAALLYWAVTTYANASDIEDFEFCLLLLYSAASFCRKRNESAREFALSVLADMLSRNVELLHRHVIIFEDEELVEHVSDRIVLLMFGTETKQKRPKVYSARSFILFMQLIALGNDMLLDAEDFELLSELDGALEFSFYDSQKQFKDHGICIQLIADPTVPEQEKRAPILIFAHEKISFLVDISRLSPLGFSAFSLLLIPSARSKEVFLEVAHKVKLFKNCFILRIKRDKRSCLLHNRSNEHQEALTSNATVIPGEEGRYVFVPLAWVHKLGFPRGFIKDHGTVGSRGVLLGTLGDTQSQGQSSFIGSKLARLKVGFFLSTREENVHSEEYLRVCEADGKSQTEQCDTGYEANKRVYLNNDLKLVYDETPSRQFRIKSGTASVNLLFCTLALECEQKTAGYLEPVIMEFLSFQHYITFRFRKIKTDGFITRMKWLEKALEKRNLFPKGTNQSLLENVISKTVYYNEKCEIFEEEDCRVKHNSLDKEHLPFRALQVLRSDQDAAEKTGDVFFQDRDSRKKAALDTFVLPFRSSMDGICITGRYKMAKEDEKAQLANAQSLCMDLL